MSEVREKGDYLRPVPGRKGTYRYVPKKESPSFDEILQRISTPVVVEKDKADRAEKSES